MHRVAVRLALFSVALAAAFGGAYAFGEWLPGDHNSPVIDDHDMQMSPDETMP